MIIILVTREMDYAIRIVRALYRNGQLSAPEVAKKEHMQKAITYKILKGLTKAEIVESRRGTKGGYRLRRPCQELALYDLFRALEANLLIIDCLNPGFECGNNPDNGCHTHQEFCRIQRILEAELKRTPLSELF